MTRRRSQNRKKKGKHKAREQREGSEDVVGDNSPQTTATPSPVPGASAVEYNIDSVEKETPPAKESTPTIDIQPPTPNPPVSVNNVEQVPIEAPTPSESDPLKSASSTTPSSAQSTTSTTAATTTPPTTNNVTQNDVVAANNQRNTAKSTTPPTPSTTVATSTPPSSATTTDSVDKNEILNNKVLKEQSNREERDQQQQQQQPDDLSPTSSNHVTKAKLKYDYKVDQWSPLNPEGKKLYDRNFLLNLQFSQESTVKPAGLTHLPDIILDSPHRRAEDQPTRLGSDNRRDFTPGYIKPTTKPPTGGGKRGSHQKSRGMGGTSTDGPQRKIITIPQIDIQLHTAENAWKPLHKDSSEKDPEELKTESLYRAVMSILNKLTPQKFETLVSQVLDLEINTEERLKGCIDRVFEKAIDEPNFSVAYANMCKCMTVLKVPSANNPNEFVLFRNLLLNRCQKEFQKDRASEQDIERRMKEIEEATSEEDKKRLREEMEIKQYNDKRRSLGNIRFIGELFKLKMLTEKIMHDCLVHLLKSDDEENYECLCRLMTTIGKDIDHPKSKQRVDTYFVQLDKITKKKKVPTATLR